MLDQAGFPNTIIVLSNNLDELVIWQIITQIQEEAPRYGIDPEKLIKRLVYGVGTRLIVSEGDPALGGVYKLVAVCEDGKWIPAIKISESPAKTPNPGHKSVWRIYDHRGKAVADLLSLADEKPDEMETIMLRHPSEPTKYRTLNHEQTTWVEPLLVEVLKNGKMLIDKRSIEELRSTRKIDVDRLDPGVRRLMNPHFYHVSLTESLWELKQSLIASALAKNKTSKGI
jgi:nicotinate phosphoribosyltransferase